MVWHIKMLHAALDLPLSVTCTHHYLQPPSNQTSIDGLLSDITTSDLEDDEESISAPTFSPMSAFSEGGSDSEDDISEEEQDEEAAEESYSTPALQERDCEETVATSRSTVNSGTEIWKGFKIVGDNIDKTVRASFQRIERSTQSFHYFHVYATLDRVDFSGLSDVSPSKSVIDPLSFLPSDEDVALVKRDMSVLISRYTVMYCHVNNSYDQISPL